MLITHSEKFGYVKPSFLSYFPFFFMSQHYRAFRNSPLTVEILSAAEVIHICSWK